MTTDELSYASPDAPFWKRKLIRTIENLSGRRKILPLYHYWARDIAGKDPMMWNKALELIHTKLELDAPTSWHENVPDGPLLIIANHPFGIADGIAALAIAEHIGRPYRIVLNQDFMGIPEIAPLGLPIDFSDTKKAINTNVRTRAEAHRLLQEGTAIIIFPSGGVATAFRPWERAKELPWKQFVVRLARKSKASLLPIYFTGQNSPLFHLVSRFSLPMRLALLVSEFRRHIGSTIKARIGAPVGWETLIAENGSTLAQLDELYLLVHRLEPGTPIPDTLRLQARQLQAFERFPWPK